MSDSLKKISNITSFEEIQSGFSFLDSSESIHDYLIELGKELPKINDEDKSPQNKVSGCQSNVWIFKSQDGSFQADSDSVMVKGILHILLSIISSQDFQMQKSKNQNFNTVEYIENTLKKIGLMETLSTFRKTGISSSIKKFQELL